MKTKAIFLGITVFLATSYLYSNDKLLGNIEDDLYVSISGGIKCNLPILTGFEISGDNHTLEDENVKFFGKDGILMMFKLGTSEQARLAGKSSFLIDYELESSHTGKLDKIEQNIKHRVLDVYDQSALVSNNVEIDGHKYRYIQLKTSIDGGAADYHAFLYTVTNSVLVAYWANVQINSSAINPKDAIDLLFNGCKHDSIKSKLI